VENFAVVGLIISSAGENPPESHEKSARVRGMSIAPCRGMVTRERIESVLERVRPFLNADGGDIELVAVEGNSAYVRLTGMCAGCPSAHMTLHVGIETALREEIPEFETLRVA
jgi:Fe-S cluster biogenesis protein NfuA